MIIVPTANAVCCWVFNPVVLSAGAATAVVGVSAISTKELSTSIVILKTLYGNVRRNVLTTNVKCTFQNITYFYAFIGDFDIKILNWRFVAS